MNIITEGLHVMQDPLSLSAVRQPPNLSQQDKPETQSFQAHGTFFFFSPLFHPLSLLAPPALLPPPDLLLFDVITTPGLAV